MAKKIKVQRKFLNKGTLHSGSFIVTKITEPDYDRPSKIHGYTGINASVMLSDCSRNIELEFDSPSFSDKKEFEEYLDNCTYKISTIVSTLMEFNNDLVEAYKKLESFKKPKKRKKK